MFFHVLRPAAAGGGRDGRAAAAASCGPLLQNFQLHQSPGVAGGGGGGGGGTVFLAILHHIMFFMFSHCFLMFFDGFKWF